MLTYPARFKVDIQYHIRTNYGNRMIKAITSLSLNGLQLPVLLGVYPKEQLKKQLVIVDAKISFQAPPNGCFSDCLAETVCYDKLINHLKEALEDKKYQLIECLTRELGELIKGFFGEGVKISVKVTKFPESEGLVGGVTFEWEG